MWREKTLTRSVHHRTERECENRRVPFAGVGTFFSGLPRGERGADRCGEDLWLPRPPLRCTPRDDPVTRWRPRLPARGIISSVFGPMSSRPWSQRSPAVEGPAGYFAACAERLICTDLPPRKPWGLR